MPLKLTEEQKIETLKKRKDYLRNYMRIYMKNIYGDEKREYNRILSQKRRDNLKKIIQPI